MGAQGGARLGLGRPHPLTLALSHTTAPESPGSRKFTDPLIGTILVGSETEVAGGGGIMWGCQPLAHLDQRLLVNVGQDYNALILLLN